MNPDDDSEIDLSESIGSLGNLLTNTINQIRTSTGQIQTAIGGTQPTTTTTTTATSGLAPVVIIAAVAGLAFYLWRRS